jgi:hypothetical protein
MYTNSDGEFNLIVLFYIILIFSLTSSIIGIKAFQNVDKYKKNIHSRNFLIFNTSIVSLILILSLIGFIMAVFSSSKKKNSLY